jgi:hypothetical protein
MIGSCFSIGFISFPTINTQLHAQASEREREMGAGLLAVKSGFILFIKDYQFSLQINTLERERDREPAPVSPCTD